MPTDWSKKDHKFIEFLKENSVKDAAVKAGFSENYGAKKLFHMREKYKQCRKIINMYENWRKTPRLDKLLTDGSIND